MDSHFSQHVYNESTEDFAHARRKRRKLARQCSYRTTSGACRPRKIDYPGSNNKTEFIYDGLEKRAKIIETANGSVTSTKQLIWAAFTPIEERDAGGSVTSQYFAHGQKTSGSDYFYETSGGCNNITALSNSSGVIITTITYSPYGHSIIRTGTVVPDFGFAGYYQHQRSGLSLTCFRIYSPSLGRWFSRDPSEEAFSRNLYPYAKNNPICFSDPAGLKEDGCKIHSARLNAESRYQWAFLA